MHACLVRPVASGALLAVAAVLTGCGGGSEGGGEPAVGSAAGESTGAPLGARYGFTYEIEESLVAAGIRCQDAEWPDYDRDDHRTACFLTGRLPVEDSGEATEWLVWPDASTEIDGSTLADRTEGLVECRSIVGENWVLELGREENLAAVLAVVGGQPFGADCGA